MSIKRKSTKISNNKRLKLLSEAEIGELFGLPKFTNDERKTYFSLNKKELKTMFSRGSLESKVHFVLQSGYFKATAQFFNCKFSHVSADVNFILHKYFNDARLKSNSVAKQTRQSNQTLITKLMGYKSNKLYIKKVLTKMLRDKAKICNNPVYLFQEFLSYSSQYKLMLLGYSSIQDLIGSTVNNEFKRISAILRKQLTSKIWRSINSLLSVENGQYLLTIFKKDPKGFNNKQIIGEIKKLNLQQELYKFTKATLPKLKISNQNINYYADLAIHHPINDLQKLAPIIRAIYILCYVYNRHQKTNDNLMVSYFHYVQKYIDISKLKAKEYIFKEKLEISEDSKKAAVVLRFFDDESIADDEPFGNVRKLAYKHIKKGRFSVISDYLEGILFDYQAKKWQEVVKLKHKTTKNLRPIFKSLKFASSSRHNPVTCAIEFLKNYFAATISARNDMVKNAPITCLPAAWRKHVMLSSSKTIGNEKIIDIEKYEFMIYQLITKQVEAGTLHIADSFAFRSLASHLISDKKWKNKRALLKKLGNKKLLMPVDKLLDQMEQELEDLIKSVNDDIKNGDNTGITVKKGKGKITVTLPYPRFADKANHPVFKQLPQINIADVIKFAQNDCNFINAFKHIKPYDSKDKLDPIAIMACIIANATSLGINKMAETSDLGYHRMQSQMKNFIYIDTLKDANDILINEIAKLPVFKEWNIHNDRVHGSVDGQKFETRLHSFIARYSSKYFGVNKGVVSYTLCANHIPVNARIISANHHESHYLFDILYNNSSDIIVDWLSGDGHSINQVNFTLLDFIEKQFAPHFKRINDKLGKLYGFKPLSYYKDMLVKPTGKINRRLIKSDWDNIQRLIASLLLGETSQHFTVSKLSSYKRKNKTKMALWEYDKILMSIYMLNFISDPVIRQNVRRALNRGESYHQLRRAIANVHGRKFRGSNDREITLWNECARLVSNCIIYYNAKLLDALRTRCKTDAVLLEQIKYISPVAWWHINLYGYYTFEQRKLVRVNIAQLAEGIDMKEL